MKRFTDKEVCQNVIGWGGSINSVVKYLPTTYEALSSIPRITRKKKKSGNFVTQMGGKFTTQM